MSEQTDTGHSSQIPPTQVIGLHSLPTELMDIIIDLLDFKSATRLTATSKSNWNHQKRIYSRQADIASHPRNIPAGQEEIYAMPLPCFWVKHAVREGTLEEAFKVFKLKLPGWIDGYTDGSDPEWRRPPLYLAASLGKDNIIEEMTHEDVNCEVNIRWSVRDSPGRCHNKGASHLECQDSRGNILTHEICDNALDAAIKAGQEATALFLIDKIGMDVGSIEHPHFFHQAAEHRMPEVMETLRNKWVAPNEKLPDELLASAVTNACEADKNGKVLHYLKGIDANSHDAYLDNIPCCLLRGFAENAATISEFLRDSKLWTDEENLKDIIRCGAKNDENLPYMLGTFFQRILENQPTRKRKALKSEMLAIACRNRSDTVEMALEILNDEEVIPTKRHAGLAAATNGDPRLIEKIRAAIKDHQKEEYTETMRYALDSAIGNSHGRGAYWVYEGDRNIKPSTAQMTKLQETCIKGAIRHMHYAAEWEEYKKNIANLKEKVIKEARSYGERKLLAAATFILSCEDGPNYLRTAFAERRPDHEFPDWLSEDGLVMETTPV